MKNLVSLLAGACLLTINYAAISQEIVAENAIELSLGFKDHRESYPVADEDGNLFLYVLDNNSIAGFQYTTTFNLLGEVKGDFPQDRLPNFLGHALKGKTHSLFFADKSKKTIAITTLDHDQKTVHTRELEVPWKKEHFMKSVSHRGEFFVLTVEKFSSRIHLYTYSGDTFREKAYDFGNKRFSSTKYYHIYDVMKESAFRVIESEIPNSIELATSLNKLYHYDDKLVLTFDNSNYRTSVITINLSSNEAVLDTYDYEGVDCGAHLHNASNSYVHQNVLYQIYVCPDRFNFKMSDLAEKKLIASHTISEKEQIPFLNTPVVQDGGLTILSQNAEKELNHTRQFLRKVSKGIAGVSVYTHGDGQLEVTLGGYQEIDGVTMMALSGGFASPVMMGYFLYGKTRSIYFKALFDGQTYAHVRGDVRQNAFDKIKGWIAANKNSISAETIFKIKDSYYLGHYYSKEDVYRIRLFTD